MEFKRINPDTIRCIVTEEDMNEYDVELEDFFKNTDNMHEFLHTIVKRAGEEVGYKPKDLGMVTMQVMPLGNNRLAITISEKNDNTFNSILENIKSTVAGIVAGELNATPDGETDETSSMPEAGEIHKEEYYQPVLEGKTDETGLRLLEFRNMENLSSYVKTIPMVKGLSSGLYYDEQRSRYVLIVRRGNATMEDFQVAISIASDYGLIINDKRVAEQSVMEHTRNVIKTKAIERLKEVL